MEKLKAERSRIGLLICKRQRDGAVAAYGIPRYEE
jgi:hypothetical protein